MSEAVLASCQALSLFICRGIKKSLDCERLARTGTILLSAKVHFGSGLLKDLVGLIIEKQKSDGGWVDIEETIWAIALLRESSTNQSCYKKGLAWLCDQKVNNLGWGRSNRDEPRIPYTSWVAYLVPEVVEIETLQWLESTCAKELRVNLLLSYKIALPLMAFHKHDYSLQNPDMLNDLVMCLIKSQNEDGGFAPWKGHPCGSDPWCTGIAVLGLLSYSNEVPRQVFELARDWFIRNQLPSGFWPYHYIDEGSAIAYWALKELLIYLKE